MSPFQFTHVLTDDGSCFTSALAELAPSRAHNSAAGPRRPLAPGVVGLISFAQQLFEDALRVDLMSGTSLTTLVTETASRAGRLR